MFAQSKKAGRGKRTRASTRDSIKRRRRRRNAKKGEIWGKKIIDSVGKMPKTPKKAPERNTVAGAKRTTTLIKKSKSSEEKSPRKRKGRCEKKKV